MWTFAQSNPGYAFLIACVLAWALVYSLQFVFLAYNRRLRSKNIAAHGWPKAPFDADGDYCSESDYLDENQEDTQK